MRFRYCLTGFLVLGILAGMASSATAEFVYDLRFDNGEKTAVVAPNTAYTLQLWGRITGDATNTNDAWLSGAVSIDAIKNGGGAIFNPGNLTSVGITSAIAGTNVSTANLPGAQRSLLGDNSANFADNVKGWGGTGGAPFTSQLESGWMTWRGGNAPGFVGGAFNDGSVNLGANGQEVLLASFIVQTGADVNLNGALGDSTDFVLRTQATLRSGLASTVQGLLYYNDNISAQLNMTTGSVSGLGTSVSFLAQAIPEPGTIALGSVLLAGLAGLQLRRKKTAA